MQRFSRILLMLAAAVLPGPAAAAPAEPSYADVLAHPDDAPLNLAYALRLVREGHLNAAAATLERVLLTHPEADDVRLTYMIVLYRLDDLAGAKRESDVLAKRGLSGQLAAEYARYSERIVALAKPTRFSAYFGSGVRVDSNVVLTTDENGVKPRDGDVSYISMAGFGVEHRPASGPIDAVFAQLNVGSRLNAEHNDFSLFTGGVEAGFDKRFGGLLLRLSGFANAAMVGGDIYSREAGLRARLSYEFTGQWKLIGDVEAAETRFSDIDIAVREKEHDGHRWRGGGGFVFQADDRNQFTVQAHWSKKDAVNDAYSYTARDIEGRWLGTFIAGQYASATVRYTKVSYDGYDSDYGAIRDDDVLRARLSYGLPVRTLGSWVGFDTTNAFFSFGDVVLQTSLDYVNQRSNIADFDYSDVGAEVLLTRRFQF
jgi:hypothetical protein